LVEYIGSNKKWNVCSINKDKINQYVINEVLTDEMESVIKVVNKIQNKI